MPDSSTSTPQVPSQGSNGSISNELVQKVAERVYALLMEDLRLEMERRRLKPFRQFRTQGDR